MDTIFKHRDEFFNFIITSSLNDIKEEGLHIREILQDSQKFNLLCENEVAYFYQKKFHLKEEEEFFNKIQQRLLLHRVEELKIKSSTIKKGGFISIANGSRIQGTTHVNGLQPDYIIDSKSSEIQHYLKKISYIRNVDMSVWQKIDKVGEILRDDYILRTEYDDDMYLELLQDYKTANLEIPLSEYLKINKGVCREIALLTVLGLNSLGIESYYYYAKVSTEFQNKIKEEDHAVVLVNINNIFWVIDNYFRAFNKCKLEDIIKPEGIKTYSGLMYDDINNSKIGTAHIVTSRLYPETKHNVNHIKC